MIHVGPEPSLLATGFERLSNRIMKQLKTAHLERPGTNSATGISRTRRHNRKPPTNAVLLWALFLNHIILVDWLPDQEVA